jgi:hypothetical protein
VSRATRLVVAAFSTNVALLILQTIVFQVLPWDSSAFGAVSVAFRIGFLASDALVLSAFLPLGRARPDLAGLVGPGAALAAFPVAAGAVGLLAKIVGSDAAALRSMENVASAAEPTMSLAVALLMVLVLGAIESRRRTAFTAVVVASAVMSLAFRGEHLVDEGARSLVTAWTLWFGEVSRNAALAGFALLAGRSFSSSAMTQARSPNPYRAAGEREAHEIPPAPAPDAETARSMQSAADGLTIHAPVFVARIFVTLGASVLTILFAGGRDQALVLFLVPMASLVSAALLVFGIVKLAALPRAAGARSGAIGALVSLGLIVVADGGTLLYGLIMLASSSYRSARFARYLEPLVLVDWVSAALFLGASMLCLASALRGVAERLDAPSLVSRARWGQGMIVATGAVQLGFLFAMAAYEGARWHYPRSAAGGFVVGALGLTAFVSTIAVVVLHPLLVARGRDALREYAARTLPAQS